MEEYTIYCTPEQTKKARELGAKIKFTPSPYYPYGEPNLINPTAEQMTGWLEGQGIKITFTLTSAYGPNGLTDGYTPVVNFEWNCETCYVSRPEATLAAIDAALEYLEGQKK